MSKTFKIIMVVIINFVFLVAAFLAAFEGANYQTQYILSIVGLIVGIIDLYLFISIKFFTFEIFKNQERKWIYIFYSNYLLIFLAIMVMGVISIKPSVFLNPIIVIALLVANIILLSGESGSTLGSTSSYK